MKKQLIALLLSATMVCSSGALSLVANAVENDTSVSQSQSNDIEDSRGNIVKIYTTTDCLGEDMVDERTNIRGNTVKMKILTPLKFKVSCSTKYGKLKSVSVTLYSSDKKTEKLTKGTDGYYVADVTRPLKYKLRVRFKTVDDKKITRTVSIDAKLLKQGYVAKNGSYEVNYVSIVLDDESTYKITNNYVMPVGSKWKLDKIYKYYVATYSDFKEKGLKAKWKRITEDYVFEKGYYTIKGINQVGDETIIAPMIKVSNQKSMIDCKDIAKEYGSYYYNNWYFTVYRMGSDSFDYGMNTFFKNRYDGAFKYKSDSNYLNMFNIFDLTNTVGADANSLVLGMYDLIFTTFAADTDLYNTPVTDVSIQYVKGEDIGKDLPDGAYYKKLGADKTINEIHYAKYVEPNKQKASEYSRLMHVYRTPESNLAHFYNYEIRDDNTSYWTSLYENSQYVPVPVIVLKWNSDKKDVKSYEIKDETLKNDKAVVSAIDNYIKYYNLWVKASDSNKQRYKDLMDTAYSKMSSIFHARSSQYNKLYEEYRNLATEHEHDYYTIKVFYTLGTKRKSVTISNVRVGY